MHNGVLMWVGLRPLHHHEPVKSKGIIDVEESSEMGRQYFADGFSFMLEGCLCIYITLKG